MEEILASIKRVIADDSRPPLSGPRTYRGPPRPDAEPMQGPAPLDASALEVQPLPEEDVLELDDPIKEDDGLMSSNAATASRQSLAALAALREPATAQAPAAPVGDGPLEAVVREMLKPMLKDWLDQRLPEMVEELVAREIARITGKSL